VSKIRRRFILPLSLPRRLPKLAGRWSLAFSSTSYADVEACSNWEWGNWAHVVPLVMCCRRKASNTMGATLNYKNLRL
jgi:hypothetical protein